MKNPMPHYDVQGTLDKTNKSISLLEQVILSAQRREQSKQIKLLNNDGKPNRLRDLAPFVADIAQEYREKASLRELAAKYHATLPTIRRILDEQGCEIRTFGRIAGKDSPGYEVHSKITPEQKDWILKKDIEGAEHAEIAGKIGISRERVRQICLEAGHVPRRAVMREQREAKVLEHVAEVALSRARRAERLMQITPEIELAAKLWARDKTIDEIAEKLGHQPNTVGVQIARWRKRWPDLFPRRYAQRLAE